MKKFALIVAGGTGVRMGGTPPKQFIAIAGKPILMHTIGIFYKFNRDIEIIVVLPELLIGKWEALCEEHAFVIPHKTCAGGENRFRSVKNGLSEITGEGIVFIHDAVRPLVSRETLQRCIETTLKKGSALPVIAVSESLRKTGSRASQPVNRSEYCLVQTPQTFMVSEIKKAYNQNYSPQFTDDATVFEAAGGKINLVEGNRENLKITFHSDLHLAEALIRQS